jgi:hypothetical protein
MDGLTRQQRIAERAKRRAERRAKRAAQQAANATPPVTIPLNAPESTLPPSPFTDTQGRPLYLEGLCRDAAVFLVLAGPSLKTLDLSKLNQRGIVTFGVNQTPSMVRCNFWISVDQERKFHEGIWRDPQTIKFVPIHPKNHLGHPLQHKNPDGTFELIKRPDGTKAEIRDFPGVVGYRRSPCFNPETWLSEPLINWGNNKRSAKLNGHPQILNVMFASVKACYVLGFRTVYLLGCDFYMDVNQPYAFGQAKSQGGVNGNNESYRKLNQMFGLLKPSFDAAGFRVFNCNPQSGFTVFPHKSYEDAILDARERMPPEPWDVSRWYETVGGA